MLQRSIGWSNLVLVIVGVCLFGGCSDLLPSSGPTESSARAKIQKELDKWVAGDKDSRAAGFRWKIRGSDPPLSYKIRNAFSTASDVSTDMLMKLDKEKKERPQKDAPAFKIIVDVDFQSQAGTVLTKVEKYTLTWVQSINDWDINEEM
jgi:hypothetical protein